MHLMNIHPLALIALFAVASTDAFVATIPRAKTTASNGSFSIHNSFDKNSNGILKNVQSVIAEASPSTTRLSVFGNSENYEYNESIILDATTTIDPSIMFNEEMMGTSLTLADADATAATPPVSSETATTTPEPSNASTSSASASPPQATAGGVLSTLAATPALSAGASIGAVALGGLVFARSTLGQRQNKLDEEKRTIEEQQKRLETEAAKLQKDTSQNNLFLSTIGSIAVGTFLTAGGLVEELTESTLRSLEGIGEGISLENTVKENIKGGGFKTTAGTVIERPGLSQQELPYLENEIKQAATKQQTKQRTTNELRNRKQKLSLEQNDLENMAAKREGIIAKEEARLKSIADKEESLRVEEESLRRKMLAEKNEAARLQKELEEEAKEKARQEAMAREQRALEVLRQRKEELALQQQQQRAAASGGATAAGANVLREYADKFNSAFISNQPSSAPDTEKLQLLLNQLGLSPGIVGGIAATLVLGGSVTAIKKVMDEAEGNNDKSSNDDEDKLSSQVDELLEKREESNRPTSTVRKTLKISGDGMDDETQTSKSTSIPTTRAPSNTQTPPSFGETSSQPKVTPAPPKSSSNTFDPQAPTTSSSDSPRFDIPQGAKKSGVPSSNISSNPFQNKTPQSSSSGSSNFGAPPPTKANSAGIPSFGTPPSKNTGTTKSAASPNSSGSPPKKFGGSPGKQPFSPFGAAPKQASPGKQPGSPFNSSGPKKGFGLPPPKSLKSPSAETSPPFGTAPKKSAPKKQTISPFGASAPNSTGLPGKKVFSPLGASGKQVASNQPKTSPFGTTKSKTGSPNNFGSPPKKIVGYPGKQANSTFGTAPKQGSPGKQPASPFGIPPPKRGSSNAFGSPVPESAGSPNNFGSPPKKIVGYPGKDASSPFGTAPKQGLPGKQPASPFGIPPPKRGSPGAFGSSAPKSVGSLNNFGSLPKKIVGYPGKEASSPFGTAPKQGLPGKQPASPFGIPPPKRGSPGAFGSPSPTTVEQPGKQTDSPFVTSPKLNAPSKETASPFGNISGNVPGSKSSSASSTKKPFSPFSQSPNKLKPSFSSSGPVYMPPTSKATNVASLNDVYSSLDGKQKKNSDGRQEKRIRELEDKDTQTTSGPKKSFSPFGGTNPVSKSTSSDSRSNRPTNTNDPSSSFGTSSASPSRSEQGSKKSFSPYGTKSAVSAPNTNLKKTSFVASPASTATTLQGKEVKKSFSPYGQKPKQNDDNLPKADPLSFSFGSGPFKQSSPQNPAKNTSSFSFGSGKASTNPSPSTNGSVFPDEPGNLTPVSNDRQSYGTTSPPKPFAATGFPRMGKNIDPDQKDAIIQRGRMKDLERARNRAMRLIRDDQKEE